MFIELSLAEKNKSFCVLKANSLKRYHLKPLNSMHPKQIDIKFLYAFH